VNVKCLDATPTSPPAQELKEDVDLVLKHHMQARESYEAREGIAAFNENRKTNWAKLLAHVLERQDR
jgi:thiamine biosynthesis lipoprotein ApbE